MDAVSSETAVAFACGLGLCEMINMTGQIDDSRNARRTRLRDNRVAVNVKLRRIEVAVTVNPHVISSLCRLLGR